MMKKLYAHTLVALYFFVFMAWFAYIFSLFAGTVEIGNVKETIKGTVSNLLLGAMLFPLLKSNFPELKYWFGVYAVFFFFLRTFIW